jgi:hypothetical protein
VDIDLNDVAPALVVESRIYEDSLAWVNIRQTTSYFHPDTQQCICDAVVLIKKDDNDWDTLQYVNKGLYVSTSLRGVVGSMYYLRIEHEEKIYESQSYMFDRPVIYSLTSRSFGSFGDFGDSSGFDFGGGDAGGGLLDSLPYFLFVNLYDDATVDNYYLFDYFINGEAREGSYIVGDDENADNDTLSYSPGPIALFNIGDTVTVRANAIDRQIYTYMDQLGDAVSSNSFFSSTPYNPLSNISNGALGYFAAMSYDTKTTIIIPEGIIIPPSR